MRLHGAAAMAAILVFGTLIPVHMRPAWKIRRNALAGVTLTMFQIILIVTGYALYYFSNDCSRSIASVVHWSLGLAMPAILAWHVRMGKRESMRNSFILVFLLAGSAHAASLEDAEQAYFHGKSEPAVEVDRRLWNEEHNADAAVDAALITAELGRPQEALPMLEEAFRLSPSSASIKTELLWALVNQGQYEKAKALIENGNDSSPDDVVLLLAKARLAMGMGDIAAARKRLDGLIEKHPKLTLAHYYLGMLAELSGQPDAALASYLRVLKEDSNFTEVRLLLAHLFEAKKQPDDAWKQYARIHIADDENAKAAMGMSRLSGLLTKKPEELAPPKKILTHTTVPAVPDREKLPQIRVGIGTTSGGEPSYKNSISFRTSTPFVLWDPDAKKELRSFDSRSPWTIQIDRTGSFADIIDSTGAVQGCFHHAIVIRQKDPHPTTTILNSLEFGANTSWGGLADKEIRGDMEVRVNRKRKSLVVVNRLSMEEYLYGVLAAEMPVDWPVEALKAQAVIARSEAIYRKGFHKRFGYDVCDDQDCQVYTGVAVESKKVREAVDGTRGEYLSYNGNTANAVFSSNCGGLTQSGTQAGWGEEAYWKSIIDGDEHAEHPSSLVELRRWLVDVPDAYCASSKYTWHPEYRWTKVVQADDIAQKISRKKPIGKLTGIKILARNASGRVQKIKFVGTQGSLLISKENQIRKYLGLGSLRSTLFVMDTVFKDGMPVSFIFFGGGWGHGVGLCQSGAAGRAAAGQTYKEILQAYFPGTLLASTKN